MSDNDFRDFKGGSYLVHHGVKGMKWGKHVAASTKYWLVGNGLPMNPYEAKNASMANARAMEATQRRIAAIQQQNKVGSPMPAAEAAARAKEAAAKSTAASAAQKADKEKERDAIVDKVINGNYGNGEARKKALAKEGYDYAEIQNKVNEKLGSSVRHESEKKETKAAESTVEKMKASASGTSTKTMGDKERTARAAESTARRKASKSVVGKKKSSRPISRKKKTSKRKRKVTVDLTSPKGFRVGNQEKKYKIEKKSTNTNWVIR